MRDCYCNALRLLHPTLLPDQKISSRSLGTLFLGINISTCAHAPVTPRSDNPPIAARKRRFMHSVAVFHASPARQGRGAKATAPEASCLRCPTPETGETTRRTFRGSYPMQAPVYPAASSDCSDCRDVRCSCSDETNAANMFLTIGADSPCLSKLLRRGIASVARNCSRISSCMSSSSW